MWDDYRSNKILSFIVRPRRIYHFFSFLFLLCRCKNGFTRARWFLQILNLAGQFGDARWSTIGCSFTFCRRTRPAALPALTVAAGCVTAVCKRVTSNNAGNTTTRSNCLTQIKAQEKANVRNCKFKCSFFSIFSLYLLLEKPWQYLRYSQLCANHRQPMQICCNWTSFDNHPYYWRYGGSWYFNSVQRWIIAFKTCWWSIQAGWTTS